MEREFRGSFCGYTKAIIDDQLLRIIAIEGENVPRMELGQKIVFKNENDNLTPEYPEQEYCINAFTFPFENGCYLNIVNICPVEKYPSLKGDNNRGRRIEPRLITVLETILE
jgi:hypothetical protein